jgi:hypothetical protein
MVALPASLQSENALSALKVLSLASIALAAVSSRLFAVV